MRIQKRRRREGKTDYYARLRLLESRAPRIVVRKTNRYIIAQYVTSSEARDKAEIGINSRELAAYGWDKKSRLAKSIPAAYLTGLLLGKKILEKEKNAKAILDIGIHRNIKKSRIYAVLRGLVDSGVKIPHDAGIFPDEKRIKGEHLKNKINFEAIKKKIQEK